MDAIITDKSWSLAAQLVVAVGLLPLLSFVLVSLLKRDHTKSIAYLSTSLLLLASLISLYVFFMVWPSGSIHEQVSWFKLPGDIHFSAGVWLNFEAAAMLVVVMLISTIVHLYSIKYMEGDEGFKKYFAFLGLFTFSMVGIVLADNLMVIFMFWELVGLSSYLLIGHWYKKDSASFAANKAFIVNRVGDVGFILGIAILWSQFKTLDIENLTHLMQQSEIVGEQWVTGVQSIDASWLTIAGICLFMGAVGKSAQFPLQVWLPDAMEGPTPVSALIHAATMVAAGVYLMIRVFVLLDINALTVIAIIGAITAFMGAVAALTQNDIKKVLAYSTVSQLGYMLMGIGVGAYGAAFFHLFTHAFFKACLFLSAGSVIYALNKLRTQTETQFDTHDMRNMGGLRKHLPVTFAAYAISALALIGIPFFSGFLSKDALLSGAYSWAGLMGGEGFSLYYLIPDLGFLTVVLTALYMTRQIMLVFFGEFRLSKNRKLSSVVIESPTLIRVCLVILAAMSLGLVWSFNPFDFSLSWFLTAIEAPTIVSPGFDQLWQSDLIALSLQNHLTVSGASIALVAGGLVAGFILYRPQSRYIQKYFNRPVAMGFFRKVSYYNWFLDPLYYLAVQKPVMSLANGCSWVETKVINRAVDLFAIFNVVFANITSWFDRAIIDGVVSFSVFIVGKAGRLTKSIQGGRVQNYMLIAILSLVLIIYWIL